MRSPTEGGVQISKTSVKLIPRTIGTMLRSKTTRDREEQRGTEMNSEELEQTLLEIYGEERGELTGVVEQRRCAAVFLVHSGSCSVRGRRRRSSGTGGVARKRAKTRRQGVKWKGPMSLFIRQWWMPRAGIEEDGKWLCDNTDASIFREVHWKWRYIEIWASCDINARWCHGRLAQLWELTSWRVIRFHKGWQWRIFSKSSIEDWYEQVHINLGPNVGVITIRYGLPRRGWVIPLAFHNEKAQEDVEDGGSWSKLGPSVSLVWNVSGRQYKIAA